MAQTSFEPVTFDFLERVVVQHYEKFMSTMEFIRLTYPCEDSERWEFDDETKSVRRVKLPDLEWLPYEEANESP